MGYGPHSRATRIRREKRKKKNGMEVEMRSTHKLPNAFNIASWLQTFDLLQPGRARIEPDMCSEHNYNSARIACYFAYSSYEINRKQFIESINPSTDVVLHAQTAYTITVESAPPYYTGARDLPIFHSRQRRTKTNNEATTTKSLNKTFCIHECAAGLGSWACYGVNNFSHSRPHRTCEVNKQTNKWRR